ncbi:unnamed protein product [Trichogramma brassicae]|uniref:Uncharacterized protein n=1 Tax=Trichogramma brassicae TaxID=86971 RepID=A0A6H5I551_9HYME|nr:unnamed protein product [Trichogramma brassicae]
MCWSITVGRVLAGGRGTGQIRSSSTHVRTASTKKPLQKSREVSCRNDRTPFAQSNGGSTRSVILKNGCLGGMDTVGSHADEVKQEIMVDKIGGEDAPEHQCVRGLCSPALVGTVRCRRLLRLWGRRSVVCLHLLSGVVWVHCILVVMFVILCKHTSRSYFFDRFLHYTCMHSTCNSWHHAGRRRVSCDVRTEFCAGGDQREARASPRLLIPVVAGYTGNRYHGRPTTVAPSLVLVTRACNRLSSVRGTVTWGK